MIKIVYISAFVFLPYSIPCWIIGTCIYYIGKIYKEDYSGDDFLIWVVCAPISLPSWVYLYMNK